MAVTNNVKSHEQNLFTIPPTYLHCIAICILPWTAKAVPSRADRTEIVIMDLN